MAEIIKAAIYRARVGAELGDLGHALVPRLAHARARLHSEQRLDVKGGIRVRRVQEQPGEDASAGAGLDNRLARGEEQVDVRQRRGRVARPRAVVLLSARSTSSSRGRWCPGQSPWLRRRGRRRWSFWGRQNGVRGEYGAWRVGDESIYTFEALEVSHIGWHRRPIRHYRPIRLSPMTRRHGGGSSTGGDERGDKLRSAARRRRLVGYFGR